MSIYSLFDRETSTKLSMLRILYTEEYWSTTDYLVETMKLDRRTILKYVKFLQEDSLLYFGNNASILTYEKGQGGKFIGNKIEYQTFIYKLVTNSTSFSFISNLYFYPSIQIDNFCDEHFVSESFIKKLVTRINEFFTPYDVKHYISKGHVHVMGNELSFRYFGYIFFWGLFKGLVWPFEPIIAEKEINSFLEKHFSKHFNMKSISISQWCYILAINACRIKNNNILSSQHLPYYTEELNRSLFTDLKLFNSDMLLQDFHELFSKEKAEVSFFILIAQVDIRIYLADDFLKLVFDFHQKHDTPIYQMYNLVLEEFSEELTLASEDIKKLVCGLLLATFMMESLFPGFYTTISGYDYINNTFPFLIQEMERRLNKIVNKSDSRLLKNRSLLAIRLCELYSLIGHPSDFNPKTYVKIETDLPIIMEKILANQLSSILSPFFNLSFLSLSKKIKILFQI